MARLVGVTVAFADGIFEKMQPHRGKESQMDILMIDEADTEYFAEIILKLGWTEKTFIIALAGTAQKCKNAPVSILITGISLHILN